MLLWRVAVESENDKEGAEDTRQVVRSKMWWGQWAGDPAGGSEDL